MKKWKRMTKKELIEELHRQAERIAELEAALKGTDHTAGDSWVSKVEPEPPDDGKKRLKVSLYLRVENNSKFVRGKKKSREEIEMYVLSRYDMKKPYDDGWDYELTIPYEDEDDLDDVIEDIIVEMADIADSRHCFIEHDMIALDDSDRVW